MLKRNHLGSFRILVANNCILMNTFITKLISTATVQVGDMGDILCRHCKSVCTIYQWGFVTGSKQRNSGSSYSFRARRILWLQSRIFLLNVNGLSKFLFRV